MEIEQAVGRSVRRDWWVVLVLLVTIAGTVHRGAEGPYAAPSLWAGLLAFLAVLPLFWRDQSPELTVVVDAAAVTAFFVWSPAFPDGPIYLPIFFATYALVSRRQPRQWLPYVGVALVVIVTALLVREARVDASSGLGTTARLIWFAMVDAASAALAIALRSRRETRAEQVRRTATEEQLRMAQDLHDGVGHGLAVIAMQAGVALHVLDRDPAAARTSLEAIRTTSREALEALRTELATIAGEPAPRRPAPGADSVPALVDRVRSAGLRIEVLGDPGVLDRAVGETAYTAMPDGNRRASAAVHQATISFASA